MRYIENSKECTKPSQKRKNSETLLKLVSEFSKLQDTLSTHKTILFLTTSNAQLGKYIFFNFKQYNLQ